MFSQTILLSALVAFAEARFGQEQLPISAISAVTSGGQAGQAQTLAGQSVSTLLAAANPCAKLQQADLIISELGSGADALAAAIGLVAAEQNFNPFNVDVPTICSDPTLPTTLALRGIVPAVDPAVGGSDIENANSAKSKTTPFDATGLSVAQVMAAQGFSNFTTKDLAGNAGSANATATRRARTRARRAVAAAGVAPAFVKSTISGLDFGLCVPTIKFEAGLDNRKATEFTFQAQDPLINKGQEEALNPNIITKKICDQLTNVCNANDAAKTACTAAEAQIQGLGTKDQTTADAWNTALGFAGTNTNPDNAPQAGLIGHA